MFAPCRNRTSVVLHPIDPVSIRTHLGQQEPVRLASLSPQSVLRTMDLPQSQSETSYLGIISPQTQRTGLETGLEFSKILFQTSSVASIKLVTSYEVDAIRDILVQSAFVMGGLLLPQVAWGFDLASEGPVLLGTLCSMAVSAVGLKLLCGIWQRHREESRLLTPEIREVMAKVATIPAETPSLRHEILNTFIADRMDILDVHQIVRLAASYYDGMTSSQIQHNLNFGDDLLRKVALSKKNLRFEDCIFLASQTKTNAIKEQITDVARNIFDVQQMSVRLFDLTEKLEKIKNDQEKNKAVMEVFLKYYKLNDREARAYFLRLMIDKILPQFTDMRYRLIYIMMIAQKSTDCLPCTDHELELRVLLRAKDANLIPDENWKFIFDELYTPVQQQETKPYKPRESQ